MSSMSGPINSVSRRLEPPDPRCDRSGERLHISWERVAKSHTQSISEASPPLSKIGGPAEQEWLSRCASKPSQLFVLGDHAPAPVLKAMCDAADRGARVYVLAKPGFGEGQQDHGLRDRPKAKVLIRRLANLPFTAALGSDGDIAAIWLRDSASSQGWCLSLNTEQASSLRALVLHWWWHEAADEGWTEAGQKGPLGFRPPRDRAFDAPAPRSGSVKLAHAAEPLEGTLACVCPDGDPPASCRRLLTPPRGATLQSLESLATAGCEILWAAVGLPRTSLSPAGGLMEWQVGSRRVILSLDGAQRRSLESLLSTTPAEWRLRLDAKLGDLSGEILLPDATTAVACVERHPVPCGSMQCEQIADVLTCQPSALPSPTPSARTVVYTWTAVPPKLPAGNRKSPLYDQWSQIDRVFADRVSGLQLELDQSHNKSKGFKERLTSFAAQAMGFQTGWERLDNELAELKMARPSSLIASEASSLVDRLADLTRRIDEFADGVERDGLKAEESEQRTEWEHETRRRQKELADIQQQRKDTIEKQQSAQAALDAGEKTAAEDPNWKAKRAGLKDEIEALRKAVAAFAGKGGEHSAWLEKEREFRCRPQSTSSSPRDKSRKFAPSRPADARLVVPAETLPTVGVLYDAGGVRYLAIKLWEDVQSGEQESRRLDAKLVVE